MTCDDFTRQLQAAQHWASKAEADGWLTAADTAELFTLGNLSPASLFDDQSHRPLVVAFFGGTGVGKSSLLNRLAGQAIARTGVERPTSREISLFLHESVRVDRLPAHFPVERVRVAHHHDEARRQVVWMDMPDIDSIETENRATVLEWLPHIDVLIYVVSPERYRDDKGWRLLRSEGPAHAWLFVMNQWDLGHPEQLEHFTRLLQQGGFTEPVIFRTDCREPSALRRPDDFDQLDAWVRGLAERHVIDQLTSRAQTLRRERLSAALLACITRLGEASAVAKLGQHWASIWHETAEQLQRTLDWPIRELAQTFIARNGAPFGKAIPGDSERSLDKTDRDSVLWDEWTAMALRDALDRLVLESSPGIPVAPLKAALQDVTVVARRLLLGAARRELHSALAQPGGGLRRFLLRLTGLLSLLLPLAAISWVSYDVVRAFYLSEQTHTGYLGADFAIHAGLLIAIAWLFPFFLHRQLKPSLEKTALRGLQKGVAAGFAAIEQAGDEALERYRQAWRTRVESGRALLSTILAQPELDQENQGDLQRLVPHRKTAAAS